MRNAFDTIVISSYIDGLIGNWLRTGHIQQKTGMINSDAAMREVCKFHAALPVFEAVGK
jgi:hypothetical protein